MRSALTLVPLLLLLLPLAACDDDPAAEAYEYGVTEFTLSMERDGGTSALVYTEVIGDGEDPPEIELLPGASYDVSITLRDAAAEDASAPQDLIEANVDDYQIVYTISGDADGRVVVRYDAESDYDLGHEGEDLGVGLNVTIEVGSVPATLGGFLVVEVYEYEEGTKRTGRPGVDPLASVRFPVTIPVL
jgi:hypothetical protein